MGDSFALETTWVLRLLPADNWTFDQSTLNSLLLYSAIASQLLYLVRLRNSSGQPPKSFEKSNAAKILVQPARMSDKSFFFAAFRRPIRRLEKISINRQGDLPGWTMDASWMHKILPLEWFSSMAHKEA